MAVQTFQRREEPNPTAWLDAFTKQVGQGNPQVQTVQNTSPAAAASIESILAAMSGKVQSDEYSKTAAFNDSDAILAQIFRDFKEGSLPQIYQARSGTGGYNSSTAQLLANDAFARAVAQGQAAKLKTASDYGNVSANNAMAAINAARTAQGINPRTTTQMQVPMGQQMMNWAGMGLKALPFLTGGKVNPMQMIKNKMWDIGRAPGAAAYAGLTGGSADAAFGIASGESLAGNIAPGFDAAAGGGVNATGFGMPGVLSDAGMTGDLTQGGEIFRFLSDSGSPTDVPVEFGGSFAQGVSQGGADIAESALLGTGLSEGTDVIGAWELGDMGGAAADVASSFADAGGVISAWELGDAGASAIGDAAGFADFGGGVPIVGPLVRLAQGDVGGAAGAAVGGAIGNAIVPVIGGVVGSLIGGMVGGDSVICTELRNQGLMTHELYVKDITYAHSKLSPITLRGYRWWAVPLVKLMRKKPRGILSRICAWFANHRAKSIVGSDWIGSCIRVIFEPICYTIGLFVKERDFAKELGYRYTF